MSKFISQLILVNLIKEEDVKSYENGLYNFIGGNLLLICQNTEVEVVTFRSLNEGIQNTNINKLMLFIDYWIKERMITSLIFFTSTGYSVKMVNSDSLSYTAKANIKKANNFKVKFRENWF